MSRTNIDIDDELVETAMKKYGLRTKREAVDFALRHIVGSGDRYEFMLSLEGSNIWEGDLDEMRRSGFEDES